MSRLVWGFSLVVSPAVFIKAAEAQDDPAGNQEQTAAAAQADATDQPDAAALAALQPLFKQIVTAKSTRATVELSADTVIDGAVIKSQKSVYQIASTAPDLFTVYLKDDNQRTRLYGDGKTTTIAFSESAFTTLEQPTPLQQAVFQLPVPMGPYPEAALALTLAGVDPALTLTTGMKSVRVVGEEAFRGKTPSVHVAGVQDDDVKWDLWITREDKPTPLRLRVDLTEMLRANGDLELPDGYQYALRFDYKLWRINHPNDPSLYQYKKIEGATEYESVDAYLNQ